MVQTWLSLLRWHEAVTTGVDECKVLDIQSDGRVLLLDGKPNSAVPCMGRCKSIVVIAATAPRSWLMPCVADVYGGLRLCPACGTW